MIDTEGRDISGNRVFMAQGTLHLVSEVDIEYFLARPTIFDVSQDVELVFYAKDVNGVIVGFELPNGATLPLSTDIPAILTRLNAIESLNNAQQNSIATLQTVNAAQDTLIANNTSINTAQSTAIAVIQAVNAAQDVLITALQTAVAALQAGGGTSTFTVSSVSSPTANEGANLVFTIALTGTTQQAQTFAFTVGGTATANTDYASPLTYSSGVTISGSNLVVPSGVTNFTATTLTATDALTESTETVILTIGGVSGTGSITNVAAGAGVIWDSGATTWDSGAVWA